MELRKAIARLIALAAALVGSSLSAPASAQAWIGEYAARIAAEKRAGEIAMNCHSGIPFDIKEQPVIAAQAEQLIRAYADLSSTSDVKTRWLVLDSDPKDARWRRGTVERLFGALGTELDAPVPALKRVAFEVGGDGETARGLWRSSEGVPTIYLIDFLSTTGKLLANSWRINRIAIMPDSAEAEQLVYPYCKPDADIPGNLLAVLYGSDGKAFKPR